MKLDYNVATRQVTLDATPQEIAELAPSALERALSSIVKIVGKWYAGTFEWLRKGQSSKPVSVLNQTGGKGDHFKVAPLSTWVPKPGDEFYVMVSGHARAAGWNVLERANPVKVRWP